MVLRGIVFVVGSAKLDVTDGYGQYVGGVVMMMMMMMMMMIALLEFARRTLSLLLPSATIELVGVVWMLPLQRRSRQW